MQALGVVGGGAWCRPAAHSRGGGPGCTPSKPEAPAGRPWCPWCVCGSQCWLPGQEGGVGVSKAGSRCSSDKLGLPRGGETLARRAPGLADVGRATGPGVQADQ